MMQDQDANFYKTQRAFYIYWENREITPGCGYKPFKRWEQRMQNNIDEFGNRLPADRIAKAIQANGGKSLGGSWKPVGPNFEYTTQFGDFPGVGRVNAIAFDPADPNTVYIGAPAGGLWKTTDYGENWVALTDYLPSLGVSAILVDPTDPNTVYIGTGDRDADDAPGIGVYKSTDGGTTWNAMNAGIENATVNEMVMDYTNPQTIVAATDNGIWRTTDGAQTWTATTNNASYKDIVIHPTDPNTMYAALGRIFRSDDNGQTWTMLTGMPSANRIVLAVSESTPDVVYATLANQRSLLAFYRSDDKGQSFQQIMNSVNILGYNAAGNNPADGQAWYDLDLVANPQVPGEIYSAGIHVWRSVDSGATWLHHSQGVHVDMHVMAYSPHTNDLFLGNDGGIYRRNDGEPNWTDISKNVYIGQIYKCAQSQQTANLCLAGFQDNGTGQFNGQAWNRVLGGDGMMCRFDPNDDQYAYASSQYGNVNRRIGTGGFGRIAGENHNGITEPGPWVTPYIVSEHNGNVMYSGYTNMWRTINAQTPDRNDVVWERMGPDLGNQGTGMDVVETNAVDSNVVYCAKDANLYVTTNAMDSAHLITWTNVFSFPASGNITDIESHPTDSFTVYITKGSEVLKSVDRGLTWTIFSTGLPAVTANSVLYDEDADEGLYIGTEIGAYYYENGFAEFVRFSEGLPEALDIREIDIFYGDANNDKRLRLCSYGRGLWESDAYGSTTTPFPPIAIINPQSDQFEAFETFTLDLGFYINLDVMPVTGFDVSDIEVGNATLSNFQNSGPNFSVDVTPTSYGEVWVTIPNATAQWIDPITTTGYDNIESDTFKISFREVPSQLGILGPGGVGDSSSISLWLKAGVGMAMDSAGTASTNDGDPVGYWSDVSGHMAYADQPVDSVLPILRTGAEGINGRPAIEFVPQSDNDGSFIIARDIDMGQNFSVFTLTQSANNGWNDHGWIASSRERNGFILHNSKWTISFYAHVRDKDNKTDNGWTTNIGDIDDPHIYGMVYSENSLNGNIHTVSDGQDSERSILTNGRDAVNAIDIQFGKDRDDRPGAGKMSETFIYRTDLNAAQLLIVKNYMAAKYAIDLREETLYAHGQSNGYEVAGIGRANANEWHGDAQGTGIIRISNASGMSDGEYLLWGHDSSSVNSWSAMSQLEGISRVSRTWRADEAGDVGEIDVEIATSKVPSISGDLLYGILVDESSTYESSPYIHVLTSAMDTLSANLNLPDDAYFTIVAGTQKDFDLINANYDDFNFIVYPNPGDGNFFVEITNSEAIEGNVRIINSLGQLVEDYDLDAGKRVIFSVKEYPSGTYFVQFEGNDQKIVKKVVVY